MLSSSEDQKIVQLALNSSEDILVTATDDGQILSFCFKLPGLLEVRKKFKKFFDILSINLRTFPSLFIFYSLLPMYSTQKNVLLN